MSLEMTTVVNWAYINKNKHLIEYGVEVFIQHTTLVQHISAADYREAH